MGGGGVIKKSAYKKGGGLPDFFFVFFFFKQILTVLSGLTVYGLQASLRLTIHNWQFKANKENSHTFYEMICSNTASRGLPR